MYRFLGAVIFGTVQIAVPVQNVYRYTDGLFVPVQIVYRHRCVPIYRTAFYTGTLFVLYRTDNDGFRKIFIFLFFR